MSQSAALVKVEGMLPARPLAELPELMGVLERLRKEDLAYVLTPVARIDYIKPFHQVSLRAVWIDPSFTREKGRDGRDFFKAGPHVYHNPAFNKDDEVSLGKGGLTAILSAGGDSVVTERTDDRARRYFAEFRALIYHQDFDGEWRQYPGTRPVDLADGAPEAVAMGPKQLAMARQFVAMLAESKAIGRAARSIYSLQQSYKVSDLQRKPFVVPKLVKHWDLSDPDQKRAAIEEAKGSETRLFGALAASRSTVTVPELPPAENGAPKAEAPAPAAEKKAAPATAAPAPPAEFDEDLPDFDKPAPVVCTCPCGDQTEITPEQAEKTKQKTGGVARCEACYPGRTFDYARHQGLRSLGLPKWPALTADGIKAAWAAAGPKK